MTMSFKNISSCAASMLQKATVVAISRSLSVATVAICMGPPNPQNGWLMRIIMALALLFPLSALAAKVVSDPVDPRVTHCGVVLNTAAKVLVPVTVSGANKICSYDVSNVSEGSHMISMTAIWNDPILGHLESTESVPLFFRKSGPDHSPHWSWLQPQHPA